MKFKLDENLGSKIASLFLNCGHDAETVFDEKLQGSDDRKIYEVCCTEQRCLVTLDLDFANPLFFDPRQGAGIVVIRPGAKPTLQLLSSLVLKLIEVLKSQPLNKELWILEPGRIRIHQNEDED